MHTFQRGFGIGGVLMALLGFLLVGGGALLYVKSLQQHVCGPGDTSCGNGSEATSTQMQAQVPANTTATSTQTLHSGSDAAIRMSTFEDQNFGFSFAYPSTLKVQNKTGDLYANGQNGYIYYKSDARAVGWLQVDNVQIIEIHSPSMSVRLTADHGSPWRGGGEVTYYFDSSLHAWMAAWSYAGPNQNQRATTTADVSENTMGGLHMLPLSNFEESYLIPLSATNFLLVSDAAGTGEATPLANTILALDPAVATPVSPAQQQMVIQKSAEAFAKILAPEPPVTYTTYKNLAAGYSITYPSTFAPTDAFGNKQIHQNSTYMGACPKENKSPSAFCYVGDYRPDGFATAAVVVSASSTEPEAQCTHVNGDAPRYEGEVSKPPTPVSVNGVTFYKDSFGDAGLGHYLGTDSYSAYRNGMCYTIEINTEGYRTDNGNSGDTSAITAQLTGMLQSFTFLR